MMSRPQHGRRICSLPKAKEFFPLESTTENPGYITLRIDEYEVIRLIDLEGLTHEECAHQIQVSRTTVTAIYKKARYKLARTLVENQKLRIAGGTIKLCANAQTCTYPYCAIKKR